MGEIIHFILDAVLILISIVKIVAGDGNTEDHFLVYGFLIIVVLDCIRIFVSKKKGKTEEHL